VLAGIEETFQARTTGEIEEKMTAIETLLTGLFDYAGLYPPASLGMHAAISNYEEYRGSARAWALGRFIVNFDRLDDVRAVAGNSFGRLRLSVIASENSDWDGLAQLTRSGAPIDAIEIKCGDAEVAKRVASRIPRPLPTFFEVAFGECGALKSIAALGAQAKIRMGGVIPEAIPSVQDVARILTMLAQLRLPFKATAGLHHPMRAQWPLTYRPQSPTGMMHGFVNLCCAAALAYFGGEEGDVVAVLDERELSGFQLTPNAIDWHDRSWSIAQLAEVRKHFLISIGSCSFEEPIHDLESMGWL
jgi:hypothetical protein